MAGSQSQREARLADQVFGRDEADVVVLYHDAARTVADPGYRQAVTAALSRLPRADVARVTTYWSTGSPALVSGDRHSTYAVLQLTGADDAARHRTYDAIKGELAAAPPGLTARIGGTVPLEVAINSEVTSDIAGHDAAARPGQLVGAPAAAPAVRQVRHQGGGPRGAGRPGPVLTGQNGPWYP